MADNVILMTWPESSKSYEAFAKLRQLSADGAITLVGAAVVQRNQDGALAIEDGSDAESGEPTLAGGLIGMLVGVLGGPLGMLLGWAGGALIGTAVDVDRATDITGALGELSKAIPPGTTGLVAEVQEGSTAAVDRLAEESGARLERRPTDEVLSELAAAEDAADAAARAAAEKVREEHRAERKAEREERLARLRSRLGLS